MAASYPGAVKIFSAVVNGVTKLVASLFNSPYDEITAIETELGTDVAGSMSDLKERLAVSINDDGTVKKALGAWTDKSAGYGAQQAATDGFVIARHSHAGAGSNKIYVNGYTDANADPTTLVAASQITEGSVEVAIACITFPVKKGDYWKVTTGQDIASTEVITVWFCAIGS